METRFLLDTDIFIYIRQKRPEEVSRRFSKLHPGEAAISVITLRRASLRCRQERPPCPKRSRD